MVALPASYELTCACGRPLKGERQARHQVVACPGCGRGVFVLPRSPFDQAAPPVTPTPSPWRRWRAPLVAAVACLSLVLAGFSIAIPFLPRDKKRAEARAERKERSDPSTILEEARRALSQGRFRVAWRLYDEAAGLTTLGREAAQLSRQADLLASLSPRSLEEVVRHAKLVRDPAEWEGQFDDYRGRSVLLDDIVRRDAAGEPALANYVVEAGDVTARVDLGELEVLRGLPLDDGPRLIFGAKLARCVREEGGGWVIRFAPDSGVLMTDLAAVEACYPTPVDPSVKETLERQARWLDERAGGPDRKEK